MGKMMRTQSRSLLRFAAIPASIAAIVSLSFTANVFAEKIKYQPRPASDIPSIAAPTFIHTGRAPLPPSSGLLPSKPNEGSLVEPIMQEAGHVIRRLGFGPSKKELKIYKKQGLDRKSVV